MKNLEKSRFTAEEIAMVLYSVGNIFNVSINKAGNIKLEWKIPFETDVYYYGHGTKYYQIYRPANGKIIMRGMTRTPNGGIRNVYPLNMPRTKKTVVTEYSTWTYQAYNIEDSYFNTMENAMEYFENYLQKYHSERVEKILAA